ncbi:MAG: hypothetical protein ACE5E6_02470 [Phycisphaerae bacterium]
MAAAAQPTRRDEPLARSDASARGAASLRFADVVPSDTPVFITIRNLGDMNRALTRLHAWNLISLVDGRTAEEAVAFDLRASLLRVLGTRTAAGTKALMSAEVAAVARSWSQLHRAIWLVRTRDDAVLDAWFPADRRTMEHADGGLRLFRTQDGLRVSARGGIVAIARPATARNLLRDTMRLMAGAEDAALAASPAYAALMADLPPGYLAAVYQSYMTPTGGAAVGSLLPALQRVAVGVYEGGDTLDMQFRGQRRITHDAARVTDAAIERLRQLPRTTLLAYATTVSLTETRAHAVSGAGDDGLDAASGAGAAGLDVASGAPGGRDAAPGPGSSAGSDDGAGPGPEGGGGGVAQAEVAAAPDAVGGSVRRSLAVFKSLVAAAQREAGLFPEPGPPMIVVWGQTLADRRSVPQVAVMVQCADALAVRRRAERFAQSLLTVIGAIDAREAAAYPVLTRSTHLGTDITHVPIGRYAARSPFPLVRQLEGAEPSFAAVGDWCVFAFSAEHIRRIIDARLGLFPTLGAVPDVGALCDAKRSYETLLVLQPALASRVLARWCADYEQGTAPLLDPAWWDHAAGGGASPLGNIGIGIQQPPEPGVAVVARVDAGTPADGVLHVGDRIIGVDGRLLALNRADVDFHSRLANSDARPGPTLRVVRGAAAMNIVLPVPDVGRRSDGAGVTPVDALREIASLGRGIRFASFAVDRRDADTYAGRLSLRFARSRPHVGGRAGR